MAAFSHPNIVAIFAYLVRIPLGLTSTGLKTLCWHPVVLTAIGIGLLKVGRLISFRLSDHDHDE